MHLTNRFRDALVWHLQTATPRVSEVSYNSAINACAKRGEWQSAMILLQVRAFGGGVGLVEGPGWLLKLEHLGNLGSFYIWTATRGLKGSVCCVVSTSRGWFYYETSVWAVPFSSQCLTSNGKVFEGYICYHMWGFSHFKGLRSLSIHAIATNPFAMKFLSVLDPNRNCHRGAYKDAAHCEATIFPHHIGKFYRYDAFVPERNIEYAN